MTLRLPCMSNFELLLSVALYSYNDYSTFSPPFFFFYTVKYVKDYIATLLKSKNKEKLSKNI